MPRIAVGGFGHETNSFVSHRADYAYFADHRDRPPLIRGLDVIEWLRGGSFPLSGFIDEMESHHELVPLVWAHGGAGGIVTADAFERIVGEMIGRLSESPMLDAVYLDLHGAMVSEPFEDAEGELLRRVRATVGDLPIVASLDYHANITPEMVELTDGLVAFRTYPHVDRPQTGRRAAQTVVSLLSQGRPCGRAFRKMPFLVPVVAQCTQVEPSKGIVAFSEVPRSNVLTMAYAAGFPSSDLHWCGPAVAVHAFTHGAAERAADSMAEAIQAREADFAVPLHSAKDGVALAMSAAQDASRPIVIADVQDNPGGGGSGDTTGLLEALTKAGATGAVLGIFCDPEAARAAHAAGENAQLPLALGGRSGPEGVRAFHGVFRVKRLGSGQFRTTGAVTGGHNVDLGLMALLAIGGVDVVVSSKRMQAMDKAPFFHLGVDPTQQKIVVVKSSVHFRAEFEPIAESVLLVAAPGGFSDDLESLPYRRLRPGVRLRPKGKLVSGSIG